MNAYDAAYMLLKDMPDNTEMRIKDVAKKSPEAFINAVKQIIDDGYYMFSFSGDYSRVRRGNTWQAEALTDIPVINKPSILTGSMNYLLRKGPELSLIKSIAYSSEALVATNQIEIVTYLLQIYRE